MTSSKIFWQPQLRMMDESNIDMLHNDALRILSEIGLNVHHPAVRNQLKNAGAILDGEHRVRIPADLVAASLDTAPKEVTVYDREGQAAMPLDPNQIYFGTGSDLIYTYDSTQNAQRFSLLADVERSAKLCERLDEIDFVMSFGLPSDVSNEDAEPNQYYAILRNTKKPAIMTSFSGLEALERTHEMACLVAGGDQEFRKKPNYIMYGQFVSPLEHDFQALERLIFCADHRIPLIYVPTIMNGASGPITLYGSLSLALSETLAGLVMHQLQSPGAPFITGACVSPLDMKTGLFPYGSAEWRLNDLVMAEMSRHYGIPVFGTGGASDSKLVDAQAGAEYAGSLLAAAMAGTNLIHDVGYLNAGLTGSLESIILGADIIRWVKRYRKGIEVSEDTFGFKVIQDVGPAGEFLSHDHTYELLHQTTWIPLVMDHRDHDTWRADHAKDYAQQALELAEDLLTNDLSDTLEPELDQEMQKLCNYQNS